MNPLNLLDSLLGDWATPRVRRLIHALLALALAGYALWEASGQDWKVALASLTAAVYAAANKANTPATALDAAGVNVDEEHGGYVSYEDAGGLPYDGDDSLLPVDEAAYEWPPVSGNPRQDLPNG